MLKDSEKIYYEVIDALFNLYIDFYNDHKGGSGYEFGKYYDYLWNFYEKFYLLNHTSPEKGIEKYISLDYFSIPENKLLSADKNIYKESFDKIILYYKHFRLDWDINIEQFINGLYDIFNEIVDEEANVKKDITSLPKENSIFYKTLEEHFNDLDYVIICCIYDEANTDEVRNEIIKNIKKGSIQTVRDIKSYCYLSHNLDEIDDCHKYAKYANLFKEIGDYKNAEKYYTKHIEMNSKDIHAYWDRALFYIGIKDFEKAEADYTKAIEIEPNNTHCYSVRASFYEDEMYDDEKAEADYRKVAELDPKQNFYLTGILEKTKDFSAAEKQYTKKIQEHPRLISGYLERAFFYYKMKKYNKAEEDYNSIVSIYPKSKDSYLNRAEFYLKINNYKKALLDYNKLVELYSDNTYEQIKMYIKTAFCNEVLGNFTDAKNNYTQIIKLRPKNSDCYEARAEFYERIKDYNSALKDYEKMISLKPKYIYNYNLRAKFFERIGDFKKAESDFLKMIKLKPKDKDNYNELIEFYKRRKDYQSAINIYNQLIELKPKNDDNYYYRAKLYEKLGNNKAALLDYDKVVELKPKDEYSYIFRAEFYEKMKNYDNAEKDYSEAVHIAIKRYKNDFWQYKFIYFYRADFYKNINKYDKAEIDYTKSIELSPAETTGYLKRILFYNHIKEYTKAKLDCETVEKIFNQQIKENPKARYSRAEFYEQIGEIDKAKEDYNKIIQLDPDSPGCYYARGQLYEKLGDLVSAERDYSQAISMNLREKKYYKARAGCYEKMNEHIKAKKDYDYVKIKEIESHLSFLETFMAR